MMHNILFAAVYGCGNYGQGAYQANCAQAAGNTSQGLVNTGTAVIFIVALGCALVFAALLVRFYKRK